MTTSPEPRLDITPVANWLVDGARSASDSATVLQQLCERLVEAGMPLYRVAVFVRTLHPMILGRSFIWREGAKVEVAEGLFTLIADEAFRTSSIVRVRDTGEEIHRRLADPDCPMDFTFLGEMRGEGVTDYLAWPLLFTNGEVHVATFTTQQPGGFMDRQIAALRSLGPPLARVAEVRALRVTAINLLNAYVGRDAGERILAGRI